MKRIAGYALIVLGWLSIIGGALVLGATVGALLWIRELGRPIGLLWSAAISGFAFLAGAALLRWAWSLLETPGGSPRHRYELGWVLLFFVGLSLASGGGSPNRYASQSDFAVALATRAGVAVLGVSLLVEAWPKRKARGGEAASTQQDLPPPPGLTPM